MKRVQSFLTAASAVLLAISSGALALPRPDLDAFTASDAKVPLNQNLSPRTRALVNAGKVSQVEQRIGVPTFFWPAQTGTSPSLRDQGVTAVQAARRYLFDYAELYRFSPAALADARLSKVHDLGDGAVIVEFARELDGVPVFRDSLRVAMNQRLEAVAISGYLSPFTVGANKERPVFRVSPLGAIDVAFRDLTNVSIPATALRPYEVQEGGWQWFNTDGFVADDGTSIARPIRVRRVLFPLANGVVPAYHVELEVSSKAQPTDSDFYAYVVSARESEILFRKNLTAYEAFQYRVWADANTKIPHDGPQGLVGTPHPTGVPDGFQAPFIASNLVSLQNFPFSKNDPWLAANATVTNGNNVNAFADLAAPNHLGTGDLQPAATGTRAFDYTYDLNQNPNASQTQSFAAATQLFYNINFFHDWYYDVGFDEASGNAQANNFGRGGMGNDAIWGEAQDFSGTNNANMQTPADGSPPTMQMFVFDGVGSATVKVTAPATLAKDYVASTSAFGPATFNLTGKQLVLAVDGTGSPNDGCEALTNAAAVAGKVVLIERGTCSFQVKGEMATAAGAAGIIIFNNNVTEGPPGIGGTVANAPPTLGVKNADGVAFKNALAASQTVTVSLVRAAPINRDGALDNAIVAHEWGHYISNRLVGNSVGLASWQAVGMGEGFGDMHALLLVVREADAAMPGNANYNGVYGLSGYVLSGGGNGYYFGIRRVPYSTDLTKNGLTFKHIGNGTPLPANVPTLFGQDGADNAEFHNTGEVWATMLWECYAALLRSKPRLSFQEAQLRMKQYMVGMYKLSPMAPTLLEMRDALLAAAMAKDTEDFTLFAQAFAKRGAGIVAVAPDRASRTNTPVTESFNGGGNLELVGAELSDDAATSCDKDGTLDANETGTLTVTLKNTGWAKLNTTTGTVTTSVNGVTLANGGAMTFGPSSPNGLTTGTIKVSVGANVREITNLAFTIGFADPAITLAGPLTGVSNQRINFDVAPNSSTSDDVEAPASPWKPGFDMMLSNATPWRRANVGLGQTVWFAPHGEVPADMYLVSPELKVGTGNFSFTFKHRHDFELIPTGQSAGNYDGAVLELSEDNGATWVDIGGKSMPTYGGIIDNRGVNPLKGRNGFIGKSTNYPNFIPVTVDLGTTYAGKSVLVRFRTATDDAVGMKGWEVDDIAFTGITNTPFPKVITDPSKCNNKAPIANAGDDRSVTSGATVKLDGSKSSDPDGDALTFTWSQTDGDGVMLNNDTFVAPKVTQETKLVFQLVVSDGRAMSQPDSVTITVRPGSGPNGENQAPTANAGMELTVESGATATLNGSGTDPEGDTLTFVWTQADGTPVMLSANDVATPTFTAPTTTEKLTLTFSLVVSDGSLSSAPATVKVNVVPAGTLGGGEQPKGCGCGHAAGSALVPFALLALLGFAMRRRQQA